jgi:hypothetical protein
LAECWQDNLEQYAGNQTGTWGYTAGNQIGAGTTTISGTKRVIGIRIRADAASTFNIDGGGTISLKKNEVWIDNPLGTLVDPVFNWLTGQVEYFIEHLV